MVEGFSTKEETGCRRVPPVRTSGRERGWVGEGSGDLGTGDDYKRTCLTHDGDDDTLYRVWGSKVDLCERRDQCNETSESLRRDQRTCFGGLHGTGLQGFRLEGRWGFQKSGIWVYGIEVWGLYSWGLVTIGLGFYPVLSGVRRGNDQVATLLLRCLLLLEVSRNLSSIL